MRTRTLERVVFSILLLTGGWVAYAKFSDHARPVQEYSIPKNWGHVVGTYQESDSTHTFTTLILESDDGTVRVVTLMGAIEKGFVFIDSVVTRTP